MAEAARLKEERIRGGGGSGVGGGIASALGRFGEYPRRLRSFLHDVRAEMKLVNWPGWHQVRSTTVVVLVTVAFFGAFFFCTDTVLTKISAWVLHQFQ